MAVSVLIAVFNSVSAQQFEREHLLFRPGYAFLGGHFMP